MGRVQDAMRRARQDAARQTETTETPVDQDARTLAAEPFPEEAPPESPAAPPPVQAEVPVDAVPETSVTEPEPSDSDGKTNGEAVAGHLSPMLASKIVVDKAMEPAWREQYRRLAASLHHAQEASGIRTVMIASAVAGEGKSLTAANLALTFSESYQRTVLLIDGDLRRPSLQRFFGVEAESGLTEALSSLEEPTLAVEQLSERLWMLPAGRSSSDPMAGLTSARMRQLLEEARERFDWVFVDTPPVGLLSDANLLSSMVDSAVLIVRAGSTPYRLVQRAMEAIGQDRIVGVVLNKAVEATRAGAYEYYHYYHRPTPEAAQGG